MNTLIAILIATALSLAPSPAQDSEDNTTPKSPSQDTPKQALPSLDDLLDLEEASDTETGAEELDRALSGAQVAESFTKAISLMDRSATRINKEHDLSLGVQRMQEDALINIDKLIASAKQQKQQQGKGSPQQQQGEQQQSPAQQGRKQQAQQAGQGENTQEVTPPPGQAAQLNPFVAAAEAAWGALPERIRDALVEGSGDPFSSLYRGMTEDYYQRLAEEPDR